MGSVDKLLGGLVLWAILPSSLDRSIPTFAAERISKSILFVLFSTDIAFFVTSGAERILFYHLFAADFFAGKATSDKFCDFAAAELFADGTSFHFAPHFTTAQFLTVLAEPHFLNGQDIAILAKNWFTLLSRRSLLSLQLKRIFLELGLLHGELYK